MATLREQGKVKLIKTPELLANLPERRPGHTFWCDACCSACALATCPHVDLSIGCRDPERSLP